MYYVKMADGEEERVVRKEMLDILENPQYNDKKLLKAALRVFNYYSTVADQLGFARSDAGQKLKEYL